VNRIQTKFVEDALAEPDKLSEWELNFVTDLAEREMNTQTSAAEEYELSDKQNAVLNRISQKYV